jgi:hypothetical protein
MERDSTVVASKWAKVVAGAGSVKSSAGTYTACTEVMEPFLVVVIRSCLCESQHWWVDTMMQVTYMEPMSVDRVGW